MKPFLYSFPNLDPYSKSRSGSSNSVKMKTLSKYAEGFVLVYETVPFPVRKMCENVEVVVHAV